MPLTLYDPGAGGGGGGGGVKVPPPSFYSYGFNFVITFLCVGDFSQNNSFTSCYE